MSDRFSQEIAATASALDHVAGQLRLLMRENDQRVDCAAASVVVENANMVNTALALLATRFNGDA